MVTAVVAAVCLISAFALGSILTASDWRAALEEERRIKEFYIAERDKLHNELMKRIL